MNIVYAFIGTLPEYCIPTVYQARLFFNGPIYFIVSDINSRYVPILREKLNVTIIPYDSVVDETFNDTVQQHYGKFHIYKNEMIGREKLFIYSFERFFVLNNLMKQHSLENVLFLELDNLIYNNPITWLSAFTTHDMAYMYDNHNRASSGCCFVKSCTILDSFTNHCLDHIRYYRGFMDEMTALYKFWEKNKDKTLLLPIHWEDIKYSKESWQNISLFDNSMFDAAAIGIFLGGIDFYHSAGVLKKGVKWHHSQIDYTQYAYKWEEEDGNLIPYICTPNNIWLRLNNLHIHSKVLTPMLSKQMPSDLVEQNEK